ncbi:MAG: 2-hydroxyacyl-CoA dehydratase [Candidatus Tectomicrobia bacterium]|uniref:2-hydroxyacyl-CoA dehydratase n=1 Tax=Tectimicrobiota bacterium TaxID=2528274 RepID=A0A933GPR0_UNCTE|nr:2-hydroxyacyl-CoA dehydratase [Candidatus Tectomicrobia bacterium]
MAEQLVNRLKTTALVKGMMDSYYEDIRQAPGQGRKVIWTCGPVPFELFRVLDIAFQHGESYGAYAAARKGNLELKNAAEEEGFSPDGCSYWRTTGGLALLNQRREEVRPDMYLPLPDFVVGANPCQTMGLWADALGRQCKVPSFIVDVPPPVAYTEEEFERNTRYIMDQFKELIAFMEEQTGKKFDYDRLKEIVGRVKEGAILRRKSMDLCAIRPSPQTFFDCLISLGPSHVWRGTPEAIAYYEKLVAEVEERVAEGIGAIPNERFRLYWDHLPIWFKVGALSEFLATYGAVLICGIYTHQMFYSEVEMIDVEQPLWSIAAELAHIGRCMDARYRMGKIKEMVEKLHLDGLVMHSSRTCRPMNPGQQDIIGWAERNLGIPGVLIDGDPTDPNYYSDAQTHTRIQAFIEMMEARRKGV